jgi:hypothetical protein
MSSDGSVYESDWFRRWSRPGINGSVLEKYERDMKDPALWLVREEERIGFETKHILREGKPAPSVSAPSFAYRCALCRKHAQPQCSRVFCHPSSFHELPARLRQLVVPIRRRNRREFKQSPKIILALSKHTPDQCRRRNRSTSTNISWM